MGCVKSKSMHTRCFLDIAVSGTVIGRLVVNVRKDIVPRTVANFTGLCIDEPHKGYRGTTLHRIIPGFMAQGGDCGTSIYGQRFEDENFELKHKGRGILSMANRGPDTNNTQFFITFGDTPHLDGKHVVFGEVVEGLELLDEIEALGSSSGKTSEVVTIHDCGVL
eukprot:jgi/Mesen1/1795/ME000014S01203